MNKKVYVRIEEWRQRPLHGKYPYAYLDDIYLKRNWDGEYENVAILVAWPSTRTDSARLLTQQKA